MPYFLGRRKQHKSNVNILMTQRQQDNKQSNPVTTPLLSTEVGRGSEVLRPECSRGTAVVSGRVAANGRNSTVPVMQYSPVRQRTNSK